MTVVWISNQGSKWTTPGKNGAVSERHDGVTIRVRGDRFVSDAAPNASWKSADEARRALDTGRPPPLRRFRCGHCSTEFDCRAGDRVVMVAGELGMEPMCPAHGKGPASPTQVL